MYPALGAVRAAGLRLQSRHRHADVNPEYDEPHLLLGAFDAGGRPGAGRRRLGWRQRLSRLAAHEHLQPGDPAVDAGGEHGLAALVPKRDDAARRPGARDVGRDHLRRVHCRGAGDLQPRHQHVDAAHRRATDHPVLSARRSCCRTARSSITGSTDTATPARTLDVATQTWTVVDPTVFDGSSAAMYLPGKVLQSGTASDFVVKPSATTTAVLDMTQASPAWRPTAPMAYPRAYNNLTILPDGSVLAVGGGTNTSGIDIVDVGLRGGAVVAGHRDVDDDGARRAGPACTTRRACCCRTAACSSRAAVTIPPRPTRRRRSVYSPPYLFKGARPTITGAPARRRLRHVVLRRHAATAPASPRWR